LLPLVQESIGTPSKLAPCVLDRQGHWKCQRSTMHSGADLGVGWVLGLEVKDGEVMARYATGRLGPSFQLSI
jgi:hypothetical protein